MTDLFHDSDPDTSASEEASARGHARSRRRRETKRKAQRRRTLFTFVVMVGALAIIVAGGILLLRPLFDRAPTVSTDQNSDYPGPGTGSVEVVVASGDSGSAIGQTLVTADVVASVNAFVAAYSVNADAAGIQPGTYTLPMQIPAADAVDALLDPANRSDGITIPEGWQASQIYDRIAESLEVDVADVEAAADEVELPEEADGAIEGWLFPSTYSPGSDATPQSVLQQMVDKTVSLLESNDVPREDWHDLIILASIIEKEVSFDDERAQVAEVFYNRLNGECPDVPAGRLQSDTTLVYELNKPHDEITTTEWQTASPYNTRLITGLPPTAISSPSESSLLAALNPTDGPWCFFITVNLDTGETRFSETYDEFLVDRREYQEWMAAQEDSGN